MVRMSSTDDDEVVIEGDEDVVMGDSGYTSVPKMNSPPKGRKKNLLPLPATQFAGPYRSSFAIKVAETTPEELDCLKHVNCSYFSTTGLAPSLLQLKQHAHSLTVLIKHMTVSTTSDVIDNRNVQGKSTGGFLANETFDWLNNLSNPYENDDRHHQMPLASLLNTITSTPIENGQNFDVCPLHRADIRAPRNGISLPYATHQALIQHANEVLELLDHEYSAKGGLLSIFPPQNQKEDRELAEATLLGQLILYTSRLVQRVHDLERLYGNALEVIKGEAAVPHQALSLLGPHGRKPREMVYPQDRFVLVNAGDDVWEYLNSEFQIKEAADQEEDAKTREQGTMGDTIWKEEEDRNFALGITALDITTRYYRLRNDPLETIFIIPAYQEHPGTKVIREMESQATVVNVVKPVWPERASMWEMRNRDKMEELKRLRTLCMKLQTEADNAKYTAKAVFTDQQLKAQQLRELKTQREEDLKAAQEEIERLNAVLKVPLHQSQLKVVEAINEAATAKNNAIVLEQEFIKKKAALEQEHKKAEAVTRAKKALKSKEEARLKRMEETLKERERERHQRITEKDTEVARAASLTQEKLKALWETQVIEQQTLIEFLKRTKSAVLQGSQAPSQEDRAKGTVIGKRIILNMQHDKVDKPESTTTHGDTGHNNDAWWSNGSDKNHHNESGYSNSKANNPGADENPAVSNNHHSEGEYSPSKSYNPEVNDSIAVDNSHHNGDEYSTSDNYSPDVSDSFAVSNNYHSDDDYSPSLGYNSEIGNRFAVGNNHHDEGCYEFNSPAAGIGKIATGPKPDMKKPKQDQTPGRGKTIIRDAQKKYKNKNDIVSWGLEDISNLEIVVDDEINEVEHDVEMEAEEDENEDDEDELAQ